MPRMLVSVTNKDGLERLKPLAALGWEGIWTGGTATGLGALGIKVIPIAKVTGFPEMMGGRLKTLHPMIFGGILAKRDAAEHLHVAKEHGIELIDLVVVNLYDFGSKPGIEQIDIGGPSLLRAAAKNCADVAVVVDPKDYNWIVAEVREHGAVTDKTKILLAAKVFDHTAKYDMAIADWFEDEIIKMPKGGMWETK